MSLPRLRLLVRYNEWRRLHLAGATGFDRFKSDEDQAMLRRIAKDFDEAADELEKKNS